MSQPIYFEHEMQEARAEVEALKAELAEAKTMYEGRYRHTEALATKLAGEQKISALLRDEMENVRASRREALAMRDEARAHIERMKAEVDHAMTLAEKAAEAAKTALDQRDEARTILARYFASHAGDERGIGCDGCPCSICEDSAALLSKGGA